MPMPGVTFQEIRDAIADAYDDVTLQETLKFQMDFNLRRDPQEHSLDHRST